MVCDFFHPNVGGVENHIYLLSVNLLKRGHKASPYSSLRSFIHCPLTCPSCSGGGRDTCILPLTSRYTLAGPRSQSILRPPPRSNLWRDITKLLDVPAICAAHPSKGAYHHYTWTRVSVLLCTRGHPPLASLRYPHSVHRP